MRNEGGRRKGQNPLDVQEREETRPQQRTPQEERPKKKSGKEEREKQRTPQKRPEMTRVAE